MKWHENKQTNQNTLLPLSFQERNRQERETDRKKKHFAKTQTKGKLLKNCAKEEWIGESCCKVSMM